MYRIKRIYEPVAKSDGFRVLVERLWPRGVTKAEAGCCLFDTVNGLCIEVSGEEIEVVSAVERTGHIYQGSTPIRIRNSACFVIRQTTDSKPKT